MRNCSLPLLALAICLMLAVPFAKIARAEKPEPLTVPFKIENRRVVIPTAVNGTKPLALLFDSGMGFDGVYLFHKEAITLIDTAGAIEVRVPGAGSGEPSRATMIENGRLEFGGISVGGQRVVISHSEQTQSFKNDGVIGWSLFGHYIVEINYDRELITLHDTAYTPSDSDWQVIPISLRKNIPFLEVTAEVIANEKVPMQVYIDLASGEALELLVRQGQKFTMPDSLTKRLLGTGLSGDIYGQYRRSERLKVGKYELNNVRTAFAPAEVRSKQEGADGILGNDLIRRFNVIFDYPHGRFYIKPNETFELPFQDI